jgi:hypothetical protein
LTRSRFAPAASSLTEDLDELERHLVALPNAVLVTIDPVTGFLGTGKINSNSITDVRGTLAPLGDLAERQNVAIHTVTHPPKTTTSAMNAFIGSQAFVAASRMAYLTTEEMDEGGAPTGRFLPRSAGMMFFKRGNAARLLPLSEWDPDDEAEIRELLHAGRCNWLH